MVCPYLPCDKTCKTATIALSVAVVAYLGWRFWGGKKCPFSRAARATKDEKKDDTQATVEAQVEL